MRIVHDESVRRVLTPSLAFESALEALRGQVAGVVGLSTPRAQFLQIDAATRMQSKGAFLSGPDVAGFRIGGERDHRYVDEGRIIVLYDLETLTPRAVIEERSIYRARVAAQITVAATRLRTEEPSKVAMIGSGRLARTTLESLLLLDPPESVVIASRNLAHARALTEELAGDHADVRIEATDQVETACRQASLIITLTNAVSPIVDGAWCRPGSVVVSAGGGWECDASVYASADLLVVDDWEQCQQFGDISHVKQFQVISDDAPDATLAELVVNDRSVRRSTQERIVAVTQGMTMLDIALAMSILEQIEGGVA